MTLGLVMVMFCINNSLFLGIFGTIFPIKFILRCREPAKTPQLRQAISRERIHIFLSFKKHLKAIPQEIMKL